MCWRFHSHHWLGQSVEVSELFVKELYDLASELGEEVPVNLATQPCEAGKENLKSVVTLPIRNWVTMQI